METRNALRAAFISPESNCNLTHTIAALPESIFFGRDAHFQHNFLILPYRKLRGKLRVITVTLPALRTLLTSIWALVCVCHSVAEAASIGEVVEEICVEKRLNHRSVVILNCLYQRSSSVGHRLVNLSFFLRKYASRDKASENAF